MTGIIKNKRIFTTIFTLLVLAVVSFTLATPQTAGAARKVTYSKPVFGIYRIGTITKTKWVRGRYLPGQPTYGALLEKGDGLTYDGIFYHVDSKGYYKLRGIKKTATTDIYVQFHNGANKDGKVASSKKWSQPIYVGKKTKTLERRKIMVKRP